MSDFLTGTVEMQGDWGGVVRQADRRQARFAKVPKLNRIRTEEEGRPIYDAQTVCFVRHPGERDETAVEAREYHKFEFPRQWAAFEAGNSPDAEGTPLDVIFPADPQIVKHLRGCHVFTAEMLAELTEEGMRRIGMGARDYKARAQKFLDAAATAAPMHQMEAALQRRDDEIEALKAQVAMLAEAATRTGRRKRTEGDDE